MLNTVTKAFMYSVGGAVVGSAYSLFSHLSHTKHDCILSEPYSYIQLDKTLLNLLQSMDVDFERIDNIARLRAIRAIDKLMHVCALLRTSNHMPTLDNRLQGFVQFKTTKRSIQRFITMAETIDEPRNVIQLQRLVKQVMTCLENQMHFIIMMTRDIHIRK
jgi:hypothetical protein